MSPKTPQVLIVDGQGGGIGKQLIGALKQRLPDLPILAIGTNALATAAMLKAGADQCATGENAIRVACRSAEIILGPTGIVVADSMLGEITKNMALAISQCKAEKLLIPVNMCHTRIIGIQALSLSSLVELAVQSVVQLVDTH